VADDEVLVEIKALAQKEGRSISEVMRQALSDYVHAKRKQSQTWSFLGAGTSGGKISLSEHDEELLFNREEPDHRS